MDPKRLIALFRATLRDNAAANGQPRAGQQDGLNRAAERRCGARTRAGHPCQRKGRGAGGRCPNHGGLSTGPRTKQGRAKISHVQRLRWTRWRARRAIAEDERKRG